MIKSYSNHWALGVLLFGCLIGDHLVNICWVFAMCKSCSEHGDTKEMETDHILVLKKHALCTLSERELKVHWISVLLIRVNIFSWTTYNIIRYYSFQNIFNIWWKKMSAPSKRSPSNVLMATLRPRKDPERKLKASLGCTLKANFLTMMGLSPKQLWV